MVNISDSILLTVKKMLGIPEDHHAFDVDVIVFINSAFFTLNQNGVGPEKPFKLESEEQTWKEFLGNQIDDLNGVDTYVYLKTRLLFDPPTNSFIVDQFTKECEELLWRFNVQMEGGIKNADTSGSGESTEDVDDVPESTGYGRRPTDADLLRASWN